MDQTLQAQLDAAKAKQLETDAALDAANKVALTATAQLAQFAEAAKKDRAAGYVSFADAQIKAGVLLPKDKDAAVAVLGTLADAQPVSFAEGGATKTIPAAEWLKSFIANSKPVVSFGEHAAGVERAVPRRQRIHRGKHAEHAFDPGAERAPRMAFPARDIVRRRAARTGEIAARVERVALDAERIDCRRQAEIATAAE